MVQSGLKVVGFERGAERDTVPDFQSPAIHDELRYSIRKANMQDNVKVAVTFRNTSNETALPIRRWESFLPGQGLGGSFVHWNGQSFRAQAADFIYRTHHLERYGQKFLDACGPDLTIQDWGVTYDELEAHYDRFEYLIGVSGAAGNIKGKILPGGNPFEAPRSRDYPNPAQNELRTGCEVLRINLDGTGKKATGVTYVDAAGREFEQPAELVLICAFPLNNVRTLLLSRIGKPYDPKTGEGVVGRNYSYQTTGGTIIFMDESININPFMASGACGTMIDDFSGDNFDHKDLGFIGGAYVGTIMTNGRPIEFHPTPPGTPRWGLEWKKAVARHYNHTIVITQLGTSQSCRANYLDLDPTYKDAWG